MARSKYLPTEIEAKWHAHWAAQDAYAARDDNPRPKFYNLVMFPYPSGDLHIGHWYNYTGADIFGRFQRMNGYNVMQPIGFDAFGLPAENAAIKRNIQPREWTLDNIANMRIQLRKLGAGWDWDREVVTCLPDYYRWTQWVFLQFYKRGLAYRTKAPANWCPTCNTTLANEQVVGGACERCGSPVERREIDQWLLRITRYADELLNFDGLDWPEKTKLMQTNWIGRSEGAEVRFKALVPPKAQRNGRTSADGEATTTPNDAETIEIPVFTTRPDTIYGVTFFLLAPEHPLVEQLTAPKQRKAVQAYIEQASHESEIERMSADKARPKTGVPLGSYAFNPVSGERIPIWIADYVLMGYGTGAVMGVPAHDQRDFEFARAFDLPIRLVYQDEAGSLNAELMTEAAPHVGSVINSGQFNGLPDSKETIRAFIQRIEEIGAGKATVNYRLRDWLVSRQRYWGAPIPILYCPEHGEVPVPEDELPVRLPDEAEFKPTGESPLRYDPSFLHTTCPICGKPATRETDTLDTFICSSWYFLRYADPRDEAQAWAADKVAKWLPVDMYIGGAEHAVLHLMYARFFVKALRDMGLLAFDEPFTRLYHQGTVLGPDGQKMSKSRGNVIAPDSVVNRYGADAVRAYLMFMGPFDQGGPWNNQGIEGVSRYLNRVWTLYSDYLDEQSSGARTEVAAGAGVERLRHRIIARVTEDYGALRYNTALAALMEFVNGLNKARDEDKAVTRDPRFAAALETLTLLLAPMTPFIAEEMWHGLRHGLGHGMGHDESVHTQSWPSYDPALTVDELVTVVVQVNGKLRDKLEAAPDISEDDARALALASAKVQAALDGRPVRKVIYVPGKLLNVVG